MWIIVRHRISVKNRVAHPQNGNGGGAGNGLMSGSVGATTIAANTMFSNSSSSPPPPPQQPPSMHLQQSIVSPSDFDLHEMQTLIGKSLNTFQRSAQPSPTVLSGGGGGIGVINNAAAVIMRLRPVAGAAAAPPLNSTIADNPLLKYDFMFSSTPKKQLPTNNNCRGEGGGRRQSKSPTSSFGSVTSSGSLTNADAAQIQSKRTSSLTEECFQPLNVDHLNGGIVGMRQQNDVDDAHGDRDDGTTEDDDATTTSLPSTPTPPPVLIGRRLRRQTPSPVEVIVKHFLIPTISLFLLLINLLYNA